MQTRFLILAAAAMWALTWFALNPLLAQTSMGNCGTSVSVDIPTGNVSCAVVPPPPPPPSPMVSLAANPSAINTGQSSTLTWSSTNATACAASTNWASVGTPPLSGSFVVSPTVTSTYTLTCTGSGGSAQASANVAVTTPPPPPPLTSIFSCTGFALSGTCGVGGLISGGSGPFKVVGTQNGTTPALSGSQVNLINSGGVHTGLSFNYQSLVNVQAFTSTFTFIPNGWNVAFVLNNSNNNPWGFNGANFSQGAGCEAGFFQGFSQPAPPNNLFALELDSFSPLTATGSFTNSSAQIYQGGQSPCLPNLGGTDFTYTPITKLSTSPVDLTTGKALTTTGDVYSATISYDGSNVTLNLYDVTAGGSCPGANCFTHTWSGINIPSMVGGSTTAWVGITGGTNQSVQHALLINAFNYRVP
jgi:hypothetical protein